VSINCAPTDKTGLSPDIGFWKTIEIWLPLIARISPSDAEVRSLPMNRIVPDHIASSGRIRIMD
jgi:hypothetical protein